MMTYISPNFDKEKVRTANNSDEANPSVEQFLVSGCITIENKQDERINVVHLLESLGTTSNFTQLLVRNSANCTIFM